MKSNSNKIWITCGGIAIVLTCLSVFLLIGGFGTIMVFFSDQSGLNVNVQSPSSVVTGQEFQVTVVLENTSDSPIIITSLDMPTSTLVSYNSLSVSDSLREEYIGYTKYVFNLTLAPGQSETLIANARAHETGNMTGDVQAWAGTHSKKNTLNFFVEESNGLATPFVSVVQIIAVINTGSGNVDGWSGSGSIVSKDGLILTNAHVVLSNPFYTVEKLIVAVTNNPDIPPQRMYLAELAQVNQSLDIAVIRIISDLNGQAVDFATVNLPTVLLGDSDVLKLGDPISVLGYPGIGGETITLTSGEVSGFTSENGIPGRAFIKTSATIAGGNSGGSAVNAAGELIGVPTQLGYGGEGQFIDCRVLADTNRDGVVDEKDSCVPTGGFINALRPINLAMPYIEAAQRGEVNFVEQANEAASFSPQGAVILQDDFSNPDSGWSQYNSKEGSVEYASGILAIRINDPQYYIWGLSQNTYTDTIVTVTTQIITPVNDGDVVLWCRLADENNYYNAVLTEDGYYAIHKKQNGEVISLYDWRKSDLIHLSQPARVAFACTGNTLTLAINSVVLAEVTDDSFSSGQIALGGGTYETGGLVVGFDDVVIQQP